MPATDEAVRVRVPEQNLEQTEPACSMDAVGGAGEPYSRRKWTNEHRDIVHKKSDSFVQCKNHQSTRVKPF